MRPFGWEVHNGRSLCSGHAVTDPTVHADVDYSFFVTSERLEP